MRFEGSGISWTSNQDIPNFNDLDFSNFKGNNRIHVGMHRGLYVDIQKEKGRYLFIMGSRQEDLQYLSELHALINIIKGDIDYYRDLFYHTMVTETGKSPAPGCT